MCPQPKSCQCTKRKIFSDHPESFAGLLMQFFLWYLHRLLCNLGDNGNQMASDKNAHHLHSWLELICQAAPFSKLRTKTGKKGNKA